METLLHICFLRQPRVLVLSFECSIGFPGCMIIAYALFRGPEPKRCDVSSEMGFVQMSCAAGVAWVWTRVAVMSLSIHQWKSDLAI